MTNKLNTKPRLLTKSNNVGKLPKVLFDEAEVLRDKRGELDIFCNKRRVKDRIIENILRNCRKIGKQ